MVTVRFLSFHIFSAVELGIKFTMKWETKEAETCASSKIFPPTPSELPDSTSAPSELAPSSDQTPASLNPKAVQDATEPTPADDAASDDWETVDRPEDISPEAQGLESKEEGLKIDSRDADVSGTLSASMNAVGGKKNLTDEERGKEKIRDEGGKVEVKHGLLKDW